MRAGPRAAAALVAAAMASVLAGCGPAEPPPPPPDIEVPEALLEAPEPTEGAGVPETQAPEAPAPPETGQEAPQEPEPGGGSADDACGLLTAAEVEAALGHPAEAEPITELSCRYTTAGDPLTATSLTVDILRPVEESLETWLETFGIGALPGDSQEPVDGLGDAATLGRNSIGGTSSLYVKVGSTVLMLQAVGSDGADRYAEALRGLAPRAVERLA